MIYNFSNYIDNVWFLIYNENRKKGDPLSG